MKVGAGTKSRSEDHPKYRQIPFLSDDASLKHNLCGTYDLKYFCISPNHFPLRYNCISFELLTHYAEGVPPIERQTREDKNNVHLQSTKLLGGEGQFPLSAHFRANTPDAMC